MITTVLCFVVVIVVQLLLAPRPTFEDPLSEVSDLDAENPYRVED